MSPLPGKPCEQLCGYEVESLWRSIKKSNKNYLTDLLRYLIRPPISHRVLANIGNRDSSAVLQRHFDLTEPSVEGSTHLGDSCVRQGVSDVLAPALATANSLPGPWLATLVLSGVALSGDGQTRAASPGTVLMDEPTVPELQQHRSIVGCRCSEAAGSARHYHVPCP